MRLKILAASFLILCSAISAQAESIGLTWDTSRDPRVVGYKIHYGTESGKYTQTVQVKGRLNNKAVLEGLEEGKTYFFVVTSYDAAGKESAFSIEMSNVRQVEKAQAPSEIKIPPSRKPAKTPEGKILPSR